MVIPGGNPKGMRASILRRARRGLALVLLALSLPQTGSPRAGGDAAKTPAPPGRLVDVGGWRLHLNCTGGDKRRGPAVVFESGSGDFSFDWGLVQPGVARFARVCSYDRAGNAWSDPGPRPRTMKQIAYELHTALTKAGVRGPYVLVGQSFGGILTRTFAGLYPKEVAGMVLVDSTHEDTQLWINGTVRRVREMSQGRAVPPVQTAIAAADRALSPAERRQIEDFLKQTGPPKIEPPFNQLPPDIQRVRLWALARPEHYAADNDPYWGEEFAEMYAARKTREYPLGDIPLIVLTRGKSEYPDTESGRQLDEERKRMQLDLLKLSRDSKQMVAATSGHHIQLDAPGLVVDAVRQVVDAARRRAKLAPPR
jgi:pimeloyl-ACP methyl ester carboxylesterase